MTHARVDPLTPRQEDVLALITKGLLNKQIAYQLDISEATVKAHVSAILRKFYVTNRRQLVEIVGRLGTSSDCFPSPPPSLSSPRPQ